MIKIDITLKQFKGTYKLQKLAHKFGAVVVHMIKQWTLDWKLLDSSPLDGGIFLVITSRTHSPPVKLIVFILLVN